ncbi:MAG: YfhO family protein, partial [Ruminococcus sp.]|nr:YfhO family protein [Ruminococcus sp.]
TKDGFAASFDNQSGRETLLFFSVPYSEGFSATVEKVTYGFMAVKVPQGKSEVVFTYATPGFRLGMLISLCAAAAFAAYMVLTIVFRQRRKRKSIKSNKETTDSSKPDGAVGAPE